jgi:type II secretory pathway component HofQ
MPFMALLGNRNLLIAVAAVAALAYVGWLNLSIYRLERDVARLQTNLEIARNNLDQALSINDANRDTLGKLTADARASQNAHAHALAAAQRRCETATRIRTEMNRAIAETPSTCPLAPSVRAVLDGLWPDDRAAPGNQDRARGGLPAGGSVDVPR